jgi:hypothetical protein
MSQQSVGFVVIRTWLDEAFFQLQPQWLCALRPQQGPVTKEWEDRMINGYLKGKE